MTEPSPAAELREAARLMREQHGPGHVRHEFWHSLADLLEVVAVNLDLMLGGSAPRSEPVRRALAVAQAYLGTAEGGTDAG